MSDVKVEIKGLAEFKAKLSTLPATLQRSKLREIMRDAMKIVRENARAKAPKLAAPVLRKGYPVRLPGTLRNAISVRTSKQEAKAGNVGVFVNVRPLPGNVYKRGGSFVNKDGYRSKRYTLVKKSQRSADNPRDPYYWRWIEFGTKARKTKAGKNLGAVKPVKFLHGAADSLQVAADRLMQGMSEWVNQADKSGKIE